MRATIKIQEGETTESGEDVGFFGSLVVEMPNHQQRSELVRKFGGSSKKSEKDRLDENLKIYDEMMDLALKRIHTCDLSFNSKNDEVVKVSDPEELVIYREGSSTLIYVAEMIIGGITLGKKQKVKSPEA